MALSRKELDVMGCGVPDCTHDHSVLYMEGACHPEAGKVVNYDKRNGLMTIQCEICQQIVTQVKVAEK